MNNDQENVRPLYGKVVYDLLDKLGVSAIEYLYLDMVFQLSRDRWCIKSLANVASDLHMSKSGMHYIKRRMVQQGYIEENSKNYVRTTAKYNASQLSTGTVQKVNGKPPQPFKNRTQRSNIEQNRSNIAPKSYIRYTEDNKAQPVDKYQLMKQKQAEHAAHLRKLEGRG